jgi:hypothetical protein
MLKKIYSYSFIAAASILTLISCDKEDEKVEHYSAVANVAKTSLQLDKYNLQLRFSTDGGTTWVEYPKLGVGQKYQAKVFNTGSFFFEAGSDILDTDPYTFDWSASSPKPNTATTSDIAEFTMQERNDLVVTLADACEGDISDVAGTYTAVEDYGEDGTYGPYDLVLTQDPDNESIFWLDNFYDSGIEAYLEFNAETGTVSFPDQDADGDITESIGTFRWCEGAKQMIIELHYDGGTWHYRLDKQ